MLYLSCGVHGPIYGRFMGCIVKSFLSIYSIYKVYLTYRRENRLQHCPFNGHKSAHRPHRREVSCSLLKSFHFPRLQKRWVFSSNKSLYLEYMLPNNADARSPTLIFRAWATCGSDTSVTQ